MSDREKLLDKVRALLAKAESTEHPAEAEAFLAGAQRLIAAHAIEQGELAEADRGEIISAKWWIPEPYSNAKARIASRMMHAVGFYGYWSGAVLVEYDRDDDGHLVRDENGRLVGRRRGRWLHVFGTAETLEVAEAMFTSLLLQCANQVAEIRGYDSGHTRTMRDQFIAGFAIGVGTQLERANRIHEEETGTSVALVLLDEYERAKAGNDDGVQSAAQKAASAAGYSAGLTADVNRPRVSGGRRAIGAGS